MMTEDSNLGGPDQVLPCSDFFTTDIEEPVKLRGGETEISRVTAQSVPGFFKECCTKYANLPALGYKDTPEQKGFHVVTYQEYYNLTITAAKAFLKLGLEKHRAVAIIGFNSPEWFVSYMAAIHAGGVGTGVYTTNSAEATKYCLELSKANIAVVEDQKQLDKVLKYKDQLPYLKAIVQYSGTPTVQGVLSWEKFLAVGRRETEEELQKTLKRIAINQCSTLVFTSGTTGNPKGVMLSHDNLVWDARTMALTVKCRPDEILISYLPLSHVAAIILDIYCTACIGASIYFANKDALKGGLIKTLLEVRPTRFLGVPRVWEKIAEKMKAIGAQSGVVKKAIATWAKTHGLQRHLDLMKGIDNPRLGYLLARALIFSKIKHNLGLDRCIAFWSGAAPLAEDIKHYFASLDIPILEVFGMSELSGAHSFNIDSAFRFDSIGRTLPGARTKIESPDADRQGEICVYGRNIFMGYYKDRAKTEETLDKDNWLHTGDLGKLDGEGFIFITGRSKEIIITAGGENIPPVLIEQNMKTELPFVGQAVLIGDKRKFLSILFTLACDVNGDTGEATSQLADITKKWLQDLDLHMTTITQVMASGPDKKILDSIQKAVDAANKKAISNAQKVQKFAILPADFSIPSGELGPTMKLKRNVVSEKYSEIIEKLYQD